MQAGVRHPVSRRRHLFGLTATLATLACSVMAPATAHAVFDSATDDALATVQTTVAGPAVPVREAAQAAARVIQPGSGDIGRPDGHGGDHPVQETIAPIAHAAAEPVPPAAVPGAGHNRLDERGRRHVSHLTATSSGERMSSGRAVHSPGLHGVTRHPSSERSAPAHRPAPVATAATSTTHVAAAPARAERPPAAGTPGAAAAGGSGGLAGGGGFALLVATLLLAGPFLRRRLALLPVVCRPAAFLVVLERPG